MGNKYSKYKRDIDGYLAYGNKKNKTWLEFEKFKATHKDLFKKYFN